MVSKFVIIALMISGLAVLESNAHPHRNWLLNSLRPVHRVKRSGEPEITATTEIKPENVEGTTITATEMNIAVPVNEMADREKRDGIGEPAIEIVDNKAEDKPEEKKPEGKKPKPKDDEEAKEEDKPENGADSEDEGKEGDDAGDNDGKGEGSPGSDPSSEPGKPSGKPSGKSGAEVLNTSVQTILTILIATGMQFGLSQLLI